MLAILTSVILLDSHWTSEEILFKLCGNRYNTRGMFSSGRKCEEAEDDQLSKTQEGQDVFCNASLDRPFLLYLTLPSSL